MPQGTVQIRAEGKLAVRMDEAEERTRRSIASGSVEKALQLYNLVELQSVAAVGEPALPPEPSTTSTPHSA